MTQVKKDKSPPEELLKDLEYRDGDLYWKSKAKGKHNKHLPIALNTKREYRVVHHEGEAYLVHRVVYYIHTGKWPDNITFRDGNPRNCNYENLLSVNSSQLRTLNRGYSIHPYVHKTGKETYIATINMKNKEFHIGTFERKIDAMYETFMIKYLLTAGRTFFPECTEEEKELILKEYNLDVDEVNRSALQ